MYAISITKGCIIAASENFSKAPLSKAYNNFVCGEKNGDDSKNPIPKGPINNATREGEGSEEIGSGGMSWIRARDPVRKNIM